MDKTRTGRATYQDVLDAPQHLNAEILEGRLVTMPRPARKHAFAAWQLSVILGPPFTKGIGGPGGWYILHEPELHFGHEPNLEVTDPDLAGWRIERKPGPSEETYFTTAHDWVCEVISPSSEENDRVIKPRIYAKGGVAYYWLIDPRYHTLETFVLRNGELKLSERYVDNAIVAAPPFQEVPFSLGDLWED